MNDITTYDLGFSGARLSRIHARLQNYVDAGELAGTVTLVARHGQVAYQDCIGMADREADLPMTPDKIFRIYSMTKPITITALMMLYEEGRFHLTDPIEKYLPEFKQMRVIKGIRDGGMILDDAQRSITIQDLMTHTSGLSYGFEPNPLDELYRKEVWSRTDTDSSIPMRELMRGVAALPLAFQPGTAYRYSLATDVLGGLVEELAGMSLGDFMREKIFNPLEMPDTGFFIPEEKIDRFTVNYGPAKEGGLEVVDGRHNSNYCLRGRTQSGGGGLVSTAADYLRFCQMLLNKGELDGTRLLGRKTVEFMCQNHLPKDLEPADLAGKGFGLGFSVVLDPARTRVIDSVGSFAWGGAASTVFWVDPLEDLIGLLMVQRMGSPVLPLGEDLRVLVYQALVD